MTIKPHKGKFRWVDYASSEPDTVGGKYLRQFWQPVGLSSEVLPGQARPIHVLAEKFTLYRGESGLPYVVDFRCAHRRAQLSIGWVLGEDIKCMYHGWKYNGKGACVERPGEKSTGRFPQADIKGYPTREFLGVIYTYFGEADPPSFPPHPGYEKENTIENHMLLFPCNWFQTMENHFDETHIAFVHSFGDSHDNLGRRYELPEMKIYETEFGMVRESRVANGDWRKVLYLMPNIMRIFIPTFNDLMEVGGWRDTYIIIVPTDNNNHRVYFTMNVKIKHKERQAYDAMYKRFNEKVEKYPPIHQLVHEILGGRGHLTDYLDHPYLLLLEDGLAQGGQGQFTDRSKELLGRTDAGIGEMRKVYEREMLAISNGKAMKNWASLEIAPQLGF